MRVRASSVPLNETAMNHKHSNITGGAAYYSRLWQKGSFLWFNQRFAAWAGLRLSITTSNTTERT